MRKNKICLILLIAFISFSFSSCSLFPNLFSFLDNETPYDSSLFNTNGYKIAQYGDYIYKIGGLDENGQFSNLIFRAKIIINDSQIEISQWEKDLTMPIAAANAAVIAIGDYLYVIGGENDTGTLSSIYFTKINEDGSLGTGYNKYWSKQSISLPYPLSHMSVEYNDGRVFLIGGKNNTKIFDTIIHARIQIGMSRQIGNWSISNKKLSKSLYDTSSLIVDDTLYVAAGINSNSISKKIYSYKINDFGKLSDYNILINDIPKALIKPIFVNNKNNLIIGGGFLKDGSINDIWYNHNTIFWTYLDKNYKCKSPIYAQVNKNIIALNNEDELKICDLNLSLKTPKIYPGSGIIRSDTEILVNENSFNDLLYIKNPNENIDFNNNSSIFPFETGITLSENSNYIFANKKDSNITQTKIIDYYMQDLGMFLFINDRLTIDSSSIDLRTFTLDDDNAWYKLVLYKPKDLFIKIEDSSDNLQYTSSISYAFFQNDYCSFILDEEEVPIEKNYINYSSNDEWHVKLYPGTYYLNIKNNNALNNQTFGILISEE